MRQIDLKAHRRGNDVTGAIGLLSEVIEAILTLMINTMAEFRLYLDHGSLPVHVPGTWAQKPQGIGEWV
jgi:hypothetical protein